MQRWFCAQCLSVSGCCTRSKCKFIRKGGTDNGLNSKRVKGCATAQRSPAEALHNFIGWNLRIQNVIWKPSWIKGGSKFVCKLNGGERRREFVNFLFLYTYFPSALPACLKDNCSPYFPPCSSRRMEGLFDLIMHENTLSLECMHKQVYVVHRSFPMDLFYRLQLRNNLE